MNLRTVISSTIFLFFILAALPAGAQTWSYINDNLEIDYTRKNLRIFETTPGKKKRYDETHVELREMGKKTVFTYLEQLRDGETGQTCGEIMKARPTLAAKVHVLLEKELPREDPQCVQEPPSCSAYYQFNLKSLLPLMPTLQMPEPADKPQ